MQRVSGPSLSVFDEGVIRGFVRGRSSIFAPGLAGHASVTVLVEQLRALAPDAVVPATAPGELPGLLAALPARSLVVLLGRARLATARAVIDNVPGPVTILWRGYVDRPRDHRIETMLLPDQLVQRWAVFELPGA